MDFFTIPTLHATYNLNFKRYEKKLFLAGAILVMSAAAVVGYKVYNQSQMSAFMKANIEALTDAESSYRLVGTCYNIEYACIYRCKCNELWSRPDALGPVKHIHGICPACHRVVDFYN